MKEEKFLKTEKNCSDIVTKISVDESINYPVKEESLMTVIESEIFGKSPNSQENKTPSEKSPSEKFPSETTPSEKSPSEKIPSEKSPSSIKQRRNLNTNGQTLAMKSDVNNGVDLLLSSTEGIQIAKNELNFLPSSPKIKSESINEENNEENFVPSSADNEENFLPSSII